MKYFLIIITVILLLESCEIYHCPAMSVKKPRSTREIFTNKR